MLCLRIVNANILIKGINVDVYEMNNFYNANVNFHGYDANTCKHDIDQTFFSTKLLETSKFPKT